MKELKSLLTPPTDEAIKFDIEVTKKFGFNGARKYQKIEDPRYYYWADKLGLLVWGVMPSGYEYNDEEIDNITNEFKEFINRDYGVAYVLNSNKHFTVAKDAVAEYKSVISTP